MVHTKPGDLKDLAAELSEIRLLPGLKEKSPGVFYWKSLPFLHFHDAEGVRWADVKLPEGGWQKLEIDFKASPTQRAKFMKAVVSAHAKISEKKK